MLLVNTLIIGTQKGGTTSLFNYLQQHPDVCASRIKETNFFLEKRLYEKGNDEFHSFFSRCESKKIVLTSHAHLLPGIEAPERVRRYNSSMKLIAILRNPSDRAFSAYRHAIKHGWEKRDVGFIESKKRDWSTDGTFRELYDLAYFRNGLYHQHLSNWIKKFDKSNLLILTTEELSQDVKGTLLKVYKFLGLDSIQVDTDKKFNEGGKAKYRIVQWFITRIVKNQDSLIKKVLRNLIPRNLIVSIRSTFMPWLMSKNTVKEKVEMSNEDRLLVDKYFKKDLDNLKKDFGITL